jgi:hypothetical protein
MAKEILDNRENITSDYAVRKAMTVALSKVLTPDVLPEDKELRDKSVAVDSHGFRVPNNNVPESAEARLSNLIERRTYYKCLVASNFALDFLIERYPDKFDRLFLLSQDLLGVPNASDYAFKHSSWQAHTLFVARDIDGIWYAGSPANYVKGDSVSETRIKDYYSDSSLTGLLSQIKEVEGGYWEISEDEIDRYYTHPCIYDSVESDYWKVRYTLEGPK